MLECVDSVELIDCGKIIESDHRWHLIDAGIGNYFSEALVNVKDREIRLLNPNR